MNGAYMEAPGIAVRAAIQAQKQNTDKSIIRDSASLIKDALMARAANAGVSVFETGSGGYAVGQWSRCREVPDLRSLQRVLVHLGVA